MPTYKTQCQACQRIADKRLSFTEYDAVKAGEQALACLTLTCSGNLALVFDPSAVSFVLKDGESGGFVSKAMRENAYRAKRRQTMAQRERDHVRPNQLQPNFQGQETGSWAEAKDAAYQSTYARLKGEHGDKDAAAAASESAKTYDRFVKQEAT